MLYDIIDADSELVVGEVEGRPADLIPALVEETFLSGQEIDYKLEPNVEGGGFFVIQREDSQRKLWLEPADDQDDDDEDEDDEDEPEEDDEDDEE